MTSTDWNGQHITLEKKADVISGSGSGVLRPAW